jgi:hypothetical protein
LKAQAMSVGYFKNHTRDEQIDIFQDYFERDLESFFSSSVMCCSACVESFETLWPGTAQRDVKWSDGYITMKYFMENSRIRDVFDQDDIDDFTKYLLCPHCDEPLTEEFWIYEHSFDVPDEFYEWVEEIGDLGRNSPFLLLTHPFAKKVFDTILDLGTKASLETLAMPLFRGRVLQSGVVVDSAQFAPPPRKFVQEGRYNHAGRAMLYLADSKETVLAEIGGITSTVHVAEITLAKKYKILDLSLVDDADDSQSILQCLGRSALCSAPNKGDGWHKPQYIFTRFVADCAVYAGFGAIRYGSTKIPDGTNIVFLTPDETLEMMGEIKSITTHHPSI